MTEKKLKVAVGMSGGVDSSVAALLLKEQGYDVVGFFMKLWHDPCGTGENACCDERAQMDARLVADQLEIPFYVVDARAPFKKEVTDYFINEYENIRTPNPCLVCNKKIKFGWLLDFAQKNGCDLLATGHYAQVSGKNGAYQLLKASDEKKDQTYFLSGLNQEQLSHLLFPLNNLNKTEVRKIAAEHKLPVYEKEESQEVCFVEDDYRDFLKRNSNAVSLKEGEIVDKTGKIVGYHHGLVNYTIGQRKGIEQIGNDKKPVYVISFDLKDNRLIVGNDEELLKKEMTVCDISLIDPEQDITRLADLSVKIRYRAKETFCKVVKINDDNFKVSFDIPQRAVTPGQFAVFYQKNIIIGNGRIVE